MKFTPSRANGSMPASSCLDDDLPFELLRQHTSSAMSDPGRPVMIVVHPGDAVEPPFGWGSETEAKQAMDFGLSNQAAMAVSIEDRMDTHRVIVIHRQSSEELLRAARQRRWVDERYARTVEGAGRSGHSLYGDDLDAVSAWILDQVPLASATPVFFTGAYADADHGCITAIGKALLCAQEDLAIEVDPSSPTDASNEAPRWIPSLLEDQGSMKRYGMKSPS